MIARPEERIIEQTDPVCGLHLDIDKIKHKSKFGDEIYYFCSKECLKRFEEEPEKYIHGGNDLDD